MGWSIPPFNIDALEAGKIRIVARGSEVKEYANQTVRFLGVNAAALKERPDVFRRYMQAYREALEWLYSSPEAMKDYAKWAGTTEAVARRVRDEFVLKDNAQPDVIVGLDLAMTDAIAFKNSGKAAHARTAQRHGPVAGADKMTAAVCPLAFGAVRIVRYAVPV